MEFSKPLPGYCAFCRNNDEPVICTSTSPHGVCDLCSYAFHHAWQQAQGERLVAVSPRLVRTYALVPRLMKNRSESDVSGYEFLVGETGKLPSADFLNKDLPVWLGEACDVATWNETTRRCYLGYDGRADFSEVVLAWAWGKKLTRQSKLRFAGFSELLAVPSADAGFYLGVKVAFESLLWRAEAVEGNRLCVPMREVAMRYLAAKQGEEQDDDFDPAMVHVYRTAMSTDEIAVAGILADAEDEKKVLEAEAPSSVVSTAAREKEILSEDEVTVEEDDDEDLAAAETDTVKSSPPPEAIAPGFARPKSKVVGP